LANTDISVLIFVPPLD